MALQKKLYLLVEMLVDLLVEMLVEMLVDLLVEMLVEMLVDLLVELLMVQRKMMAFESLHLSFRLYNLSLTSLTSRPILLRFLLFS